MRLHVLEVTGVGPFRSTQRVDFDELSRSGLFLIEGPTGSGKTTLLDSIVFALYGTVSGKASDVGRMRSHLCAPGDSSEVMLEFSVAGVRHRIRRSPAYERPKLRGAGTTTESARQTLEVLDGSVPPMREAREIGSYLLQRIGLSAEHFRQLVILPQGEFDALLRASPRQRYDVLGNLIDDGFLARVQEELKARADAAAEERQSARERVETVHDILRARLREIEPTVDLVLAGEDEVAAEDPAPEDPAPEDATAAGAPPPEFDPGARVDRVAAAAEAARYRAEELLAPCTAARADAAASRQAAQAMAEATEARARVAAARARAGADDRGLGGTALQDRLTELVSRRTRLEPWAAWDAAAREREREDQRLLGELATADDLLADARERAASLPQRRADLAARTLATTQRAASAESLRAALARLDSDATQIEEAATVGRLLADAAAQSDRCRAAESEARESLVTAREEHVRLLERQLEQRAAHLAAMLEAGAACPVCGSTEHPSPATPPGDDLVGDDEIGRSDARVLAAAAAADKAAAALARARESVAGLEARHVALLARIEGMSVESVGAQALEARRALDEAALAEQELPGLELQREAIEAEESEGGALVETSLTRRTAAASALAAFRKQTEQDQAARDAEVGDAASAAEALRALSERIEALLALQTALGEESRHPLPAEGVDPEAELRAREAALERAIARLTAAESALAAADQDAARLADALTALLGHLDDLADATRVLDDVTDATSIAVSLGDLVSARSPANLRRMTLQSYAVQRRFRAVLEAGSRHLERMSSGQYAFALDEEAGRGQSGLGIEVLDAWTGRSRDPSSLSGGETFYAALALALGLADIVREETGGVDLETLFVDEGFGSLDTVTLQSVLDQLDALRSRGRSVGVISHVTEMRDWVHDRIQVVPGPPGEGSTLHRADTPT